MPGLRDQSILVCVGCVSISAQLFKLFIEVTLPICCSLRLPQEGAVLIDDLWLVTLSEKCVLTFVLVMQGFKKTWCVCLGCASWSFFCLAVASK